MPIKLNEDSSLQWRQTAGSKRKATFKDDFGYYIPILAVLELLLNNEQVLAEVDTSHQSTDGMLRDICDGSFFKEHPVFSEDPTALQIIGFYDDVEVTNPLGSKTKKHKVGLFYFVLANIHPHVRSQLQCIVPFAIAKTKHLKEYGVHKLLKPFVSDVNKLSSPDGCVFAINGTEHRYRGALLAMPGDTLASNFISGFKEGVGFAYRKCRECLATDDEIQKFFIASKCTVRDEEMHSEIVRGLEASSSVSAHLSVNYGVNRGTVFADINFFQVTKCFPQDIMHVLIEGVLAKEVQLLIKYCISEKFFSLDQLNQIIFSFDYGYHDLPNKPSPVELDRIQQRAGQMLCLSRSLPLLIGQFIPEDDESWICFLTLLSITSILTAFEFSPEDCALLATLIEEHHERFIKVYPDVHLTPKFHYLIHLPDQILRFGPPRAVWCMRFEGKNGFMKELIRHNFKNVPLTLANQHQLYLCHRLLHRNDHPSPPFLYMGDILSKVKYEHVSENIADKLRTLSGINPLPLHVSKAHGVEIYGISYRIGTVIRLPPKEYEPVFGRITAIYILSDIKYFVVEVFITHVFVPHFYSYHVSLTEDVHVLRYVDFVRHGVLHLHLINSRYMISERDTTDIESVT